MSLNPTTDPSGRRVCLCLAAAALAGLLLGMTAGCNNFTAAARNAEGVRLYQQARYQEALRHFHEAAYAEPNNPDGFYNIAATYHRLGVTENRPADIVQAEHYYNNCLDVWDRLNRDQPGMQQTGVADCYRGLAVLLTEQGRHDEAFDLLEGWIDREPSSPDAKIELARLYEEFNDRRAAKKHLIEALAVDSDNPRALAALGKIREQSGEYAQALENYQRSYARDQFQPQLATRIAALRSQLNPAMAGSSNDSGTRLVDQGTKPLQ